MWVEQNSQHLQVSLSKTSYKISWKLEQLERLRSEDYPYLGLTITHTIESYWIPSQKKTKSKLQI